MLSVIGEFLDRIKDAEARAANIIADAQNLAAKIESDAQKELEKIKDAAVDEIAKKIRTTAKHTDVPEPPKKITADKDRIAAAKKYITAEFYRRYPE